MSGFLLDTHAVVWAMNEPGRLGSAAHRVISDPASELYVSAVSAWEVATKHRIGKLPGAEVLLATWDANLRRLHARELDITGSHALLAGQIDWEHRDPFDRMLAAQAVLESLTLVTTDAAFAGFGHVRTLW